MEFRELSEVNQELIKKELDKHVKNVDYSKVVIASKSSNEQLIIEYKDLTVTIPICGPDQQTSNSIWTILATGAVCIASFATALILSKKESK